LVKEIEIYNSASTKPYSISIDETTGNQTISAVIRPLKGGRQNFFDKGYGGEGCITVEPSGGLSYYYGTRGGYGHPYRGCWTGAGVIKWGELQHIAVVRDLTNKKIRWYINGELKNECGVNLSTATKTPWPAKIGSGYTGNKYQGSFYNLKIHNRALSQIEIQSLLLESKGKSAGYGAPSMQISNTGLVSLSGVLGYKKKKPSNRWGLVSEIPEEYRPNRELLFLSDQNGNLHWIKINPSGHIYTGQDDSKNSYISLDGISYYKNK
jgi:hypothetical protein